MKYFATAISIAVIWATGLSSAQASCYGYRGSFGPERIRLQDKKNGYINVRVSRSVEGKVVGKLRHGQRIRTIKFVENHIDMCGGFMYIQFQDSQGRIIYGWVLGDLLLSAMGKL
jgi:hypothetical protein